MNESRWPREAWLPLASGLAWFWCVMPLGFLALAVGLLPGGLLLTSGVSTLLFAGDRRPPQFTAAGGVLGVLLAIPGIFLFGLFPALILAGLSAACFVSAGSASVRNTPPTPEVPHPEPSWKLSAMTALDEAILADLSVSATFPTGTVATRIMEEVNAARELFGARGWLEDPIRYHADPPALDAPSVRARHMRNLDFEELSFDSGYEPDQDEPGRDRWLGFEANRRACAWVVRGDPSLPWIVCIHGFRMGVPLIDFGAFDPRFFHKKLGLNMLLPILPLHGPRKRARRSGDGYLDGDVLDTVHAQAQAAWDMRRMLSWVRGQGASAVGVYGLSLGGYNTALLSSLDADLSCAVAGIPATDFSRIFWHHGPPSQIQAMEAQGLSLEQVGEVMSVVSPLSLESKVAPAARVIFGGVTDRVVPPDQVRRLHDHWGAPETIWYQGGHMTFGSDSRVKAMIQSTLTTHLKN